MGGPFEKMAKDVAMRMRSKVHRQTLSNAVVGREARRLSPAGRLGVERVEELMALQQRHQRTFDPALRTEAIQILRTLPLLSTNEDPLFVHAQRALRVAAYFDASTLPVTYALINQHTKNAFLLDAVAMSSFFYILAKLKHPQTTEIISILLPRLRDVACDLVPHEAVNILRQLHRAELEDAKLIKILTNTVVKTAADTPLTDVRQCAVVLAGTYTNESKEVLIAAEKRLCEVIEHSADIDEVKATVLDVCRVVSLTCSGPRRLLNSVARRSLQLAPQLSPLDISCILKAFHLSSYRHLRLLRVLASSLASRVAAGSVMSRGLEPRAVSNTLQALAHFYVQSCEEIVFTLVNSVADKLEALDFALTLISCVRLQCVSPGIVQSTDLLCGAPLRRCLRNASDIEVTSRLVYALSQAGRCVDAGDVANLQILLRAVLASRVPILGDSRSFLLDAVTTLDAEGRCTDAELKGLVCKLRERLLSGCGPVATSS